MSGINKVYMEYVLDNADGVQHYQEEALDGEEIESFELPFDTDRTNLTKLKMFLYANGKASQEIDLDMFTFLRGFSESSENAHLKEKKVEDPVLKDLNDNFFVIGRYKKIPAATLEYADVTEQDLLGDKPIVATELKNNGIWGFSGLRKLELTVSDLMFEWPDASNVEVASALYWNQIDDTAIEPRFEEARVFEDRSRRVMGDAVSGTKSKNVFTIYYNTNRLGETLEDQESPSPRYMGRFEVHYTYEGRRKLSWGFPVSLTLHNPERNAKKLENRQPVSIDFGTSATCAAVRDNKKTVLLTISGKAKLKEETQETKRYENPTNIMVYNWEELRRQWQEENSGIPFLMAWRDDLPEGDADYDSGYTVDHIFKYMDDLVGRKKMEAILTDLKNIPADLIDDNVKKFTPLHDTPTRIITVTDDLEKEDDSHFNPIKFYGYLLGRTINNPARGQYHTKYLVSYPVKFSSEIKNSLRASLAAGILRSLPQPVRESLNPDKVVEMRYEEPVASVAALIPDQLALGENDEPAMFAVFDLGGGTLDTAFGILRKPRGEEEDQGEQTIQIFKTGGNDYSGGERLIHKLAFKIYVDNYDLMKDHQIPFIMPKKAELPPNVDQDLLRKKYDEIASSNVHTIVEKIARPLFMHDNPDIPIDGHLVEVFDRLDSSVVPDADSFIVNLRSEDGKSVNGLQLQITGHEEGIEEFLDREIGAIVNEFAAELKDTFYRHKEQLALAQMDSEEEPSEEELARALLDYEPELSEVKIFLAGNASRQHYVREKLNRIFPDQIETIGIASDKKHLSERVNAKTAVAIGQLKMGEFALDTSTTDIGDGIAPFRYNIGYFDSRNGEFVRVIEKGSNSNEWVEANLLEKDTDLTNLYFTEQFVEKRQTIDNVETVTAISEEITPEDQKKRRLYLRVYKNDNNTLEYRLGGKNEQFDAMEEPDPTKVIKIKEN